MQRFEELHAAREPQFVYPYLSVKNTAGQYLLMRYASL